MQRKLPVRALVDRRRPCTWSPLQGLWFSRPLRLACLGVENERAHACLFPACPLLCLCHCSAPRSARPSLEGKLQDACSAAPMGPCVHVGAAPNAKAHPSGVEKADPAPCFMSDGCAFLLTRRMQSKIHAHPWVGLGCSPRRTRAGHTADRGAQGSCSTSHSTTRALALLVNRSVRSVVWAMGVIQAPAQAQEP